MAFLDSKEERERPVTKRDQGNNGIVFNER